MEGVGYGGHGGYGGGFANYVNLQSHPSWYRPAPPPLTAIDRFLWGRTQTRTRSQTQTQNHLYQYQNHEINQTFIPSNGVSEFSCSSGGINEEAGVRLVPCLPMAISFAVDDDVFVNGVGECLTWEELKNYPNYDPNRDLNQEIIKSEKISKGTTGKQSKGGATSTATATSKILIKGQWTDEEDGKLIRLVNQHGVRKWALIAEKMIGRAGKQCRERWRNHLRPDIKKDSWSEDEERMLVEAHQKVGNKWAEIAKLIPGRTENAVKNQWNATKRRQNSSRKSKKNQAKNRSQSSLLQDYIRSKTSNNLASSSSSSSSTTTTTTTPTTATPGGSTIIFPELTHSDCHDSPSDLDLTQSYDDELNFMQRFFGDSTSNESSVHIIEPKSCPNMNHLGFSGNLQCGFSSSSSTPHDDEINSNIYLNNCPEEEHSSKTQLAPDVYQLEGAITIPSTSDHGCHGDGSSSNGKKRWIW